MEIEHEKILNRATNYWTHQVNKGGKGENNQRLGKHYNEFEELETAASIGEVEPKRDILDNFLSRSTHFW